MNEELNSYEMSIKMFEEFKTSQEVIDCLLAMGERYKEDDWSDFLGKYIHNLGEEEVLKRYRECQRQAESLVDSWKHGWKRTAVNWWHWQVIKDEYCYDHGTKHEKTVLFRSLENAWGWDHYLFARFLHRLILEESGMNLEEFRENCAYQDSVKFVFLM